MSKKKKEIKCEQCQQHKATYECEECGTKSCGWCATKCDYECPRCSMCPPELRKMK